MITFKQYLAEAAAFEAALKIVKQLLGPNAQKVENFDDSLLDTAKEVEHKVVNMADDTKMSVSLYRAGKTLFAQVSPHGQHPMYFVEKQA
jgi:hypothetical protein